MTEAEFVRLAQAGYNRVPVVLETFADLDTPLSIYLKLANRPHTYLLESVVGGERFGRYSFIGLGAGTPPRPFRSPSSSPTGRLPICSNRWWAASASAAIHLSAWRPAPASKFAAT